MIRQFRSDLTDWVMHFVHARNLDNEPEEAPKEYNQYHGFPYHENKDLNSRFDSWGIVDKETDLDPSAEAFNVLLKIIRDGHIRSSWAFRNNRPTIYGPRAAVCFTEMPLYALCQYAKERSKKDVETYAIGVRKRELFTAGGRPVIYGLSGKHEESVFNERWPRKLAPSCGIAEKEQFRYVSMSLDTQKRIDWSHEREWRWVDHEDQCSCPGLPIWLAEEPISFQSTFIVVQTSSEVERVLNLLKELYDAGSNNYTYPFSKLTLRQTSVVALDRLNERSGDIQVQALRLDDIPKSETENFNQPEVSPEFTRKVNSVLEEARKAADVAAEAFLLTAQRTEDGHVADVVGSAHVMVRDAQSPLISALLELQCISSYPGVGHVVTGVRGFGWRGEQALSVAEAAAKAAKEVFEKHFPNNTFSIRTLWD